MITAYHRPESIEEALELLSRTSPVTVPLGGGTSLSHQRGDPIEVVDLQSLQLSKISQRGNTLEIGAATTLHKLWEWPKAPEAMRTALSLEATRNLRNSATVAGTLMMCDGRSSFVTVLLAADATVAVMHPQEDTISLGELLARRDQFRRGVLITSVEVPANARLEFDFVARTPADSPIVCIGLTQWPSGRTRLAIGGHGAAPLLAVDGTDASGLEVAAQNAMHEASDRWGSAEYRMSAAAALTRRCFERLSAQS